MELTLVHSGIKPVAPKLSEHFPDMGRVLFGVVGIHQDIIQVHDYRDVNHISEDLFMNLWRPARELVSPSGITSHLKDPYRVWKVVFHSSPSAIWTRW